jgi:hypothetical protein
MRTTSVADTFVVIKVKMRHARLVMTPVLRLPPEHGGQADDGRRVKEWILAQYKASREPAA